MSGHARFAALVFTLLLVALIAVLRNGSQSIEPAAADCVAVARAAPDLLPLYVLPPLADFTVSVQRTLFTPNRRPPQPAPPPTVAVAPKKPPAAVVPPRLTLAATVREGERRVAIVSTLAPPSTLELELGDTVDGWTVQSIELDRVTLGRGEARHELLLRPYDTIK